MSAPETVEVRSSPHVHGAPEITTIMRNVVYALMPICVFAFFQFGISSLVLILVSTASCVLTEALLCKISGKPPSVGDYSAVITGVLLALTLPPGFPLWMCAAGGVISIALGKEMFGGLGNNIFNPALVGRAFLQAAFPVAITTWTPAFPPGRFTDFIPSTFTFPFSLPQATDQWSAEVGIDSFSGATPLALSKFDHSLTGLDHLLLGTTAGSAGETSALLIILCGLYLIARNMMDWRIPAAVLSGAFISESALHWLDGSWFPDPWFMLFSGGLMLGAFFMATDMVGSPVTPLGVWIFGLLIGMLTIIIRLFGGLNEGVMYAILLGNAATPLIDYATQPRIYGDIGKKKED